MKSRMIAIALAFAGFLPLAQVQAQPVSAGVERAQQDLRATIDQGVRSGALTDGEARQLYERERALDWQLTQMERDGRLSLPEWHRIRSELEDLRAEVIRKLGNGRRAPAAYAPMPGLQRQQDALRSRIEQGISSGRITRAEARRLEQRELDLERMQARARRDGVITHEERSQLRGQLALLNDDVDRMLSNHRRVHYSH